MAKINKKSQIPRKNLQILSENLKSCLKSTEKMSELLWCRLFFLYFCKKKMNIYF